MVYFFFFLLSGPFRLKNYLSGKKNSDADEEEVEESSGKLLFIFYCLDFYGLRHMELGVLFYLNYSQWHTCIEYLLLRALLYV